MNFIEALELLKTSVAKRVYREGNSRMQVTSFLGNVFVERKDQSQGWVKSDLTFEDFLATDWKLINEQFE